MAVSDENLTYRSAGVDIDTNNQASLAIRRHLQRTHTSAVLTRSGLFGGGVSLEAFRACRRPLLVAGLGCRAPGAAGAAGAGKGVQDVVRMCREKLHPQAKTVAFLDYIAAESLTVGQIEGLVAGFADQFAEEPKTPLVGGETAEMPGTFVSGACELVGSLYAVVDGAECGRAGRSACDLAAIKDSGRPALVLSMDGVGTKTSLGVMAGESAGLAADIIHHSLNDILCQGARGLGLTYYIGCHSRREKFIEDFSRGAAEIHGEQGLTGLDFVVAEHPELYQEGAFDICASIAGLALLADAGSLLQGENVEAGDILIGLPSSGLHTNGYSLARRALLERGGLRLDQHIPELGVTLGQALLEPHKNYAPAVLPLLQASGPGGVRGIAHITGGGLKDNLARVLPPGTLAEIDMSSWQVPPLFSLIQACGRIPLEDAVNKGMVETFNMGIGLILVVRGDVAGDICTGLKQAGERPLPIGRILAAGPDTSAERVRLL
jgi:phosphoribosylformylglycinamidine cyclo-ligase